jgi:hypothetical protein
VRRTCEFELLPGSLYAVSCEITDEFSCTYMYDALCTDRYGTLAGWGHHGTKLRQGEVLFLV